MESKKFRSGRRMQGLIGAMAALALVGVAQQALGQEEGYSRLTIDPRIGAGFAVGDLRDTHDFGFAGGAGITVKVHPNIGIRGDVDAMILDEQSPEFGVVLAPTLDMVHYHGGLEFEFGPRKYWEVPLLLRWNVGAGATSISASRDFPDNLDVDFSATYPSVNTGIKIGYRFSPSFDLYLGGQVFATFADEEETGELVKRSPGTDPYGTIWTVPVTLGAKIGF